MAEVAQDEYEERTPGLCCHSFLTLLHRPLGDGRVNLRHEADCLTQGRDDFGVVREIVIGQCAGTAVAPSIPRQRIQNPPDLGKGAIHKTLRHVEEPSLDRRPFVPLF